VVGVGDVWCSYACARAVLRLNIVDAMRCAAACCRVYIILGAALRIFLLRNAAARKLVVIAARGALKKTCGTKTVDGIGKQRREKWHGNGASGGASA